MAKVVQADINPTQLMTLSNRGIQKNITEQTTYQTLKQMDYNRTKPCWVLLQLFKNKKMTPQFSKDHKNWTTADWKKLHDLMGLKFHCEILMVRPEFSIYN